MDRKLDKLKEVQDTLQTLLVEVKTTLKDEFLGLYIHGSLAVGDFNPHSSDIDFLVTTKRSLQNASFSALHDMHHSMVADKNKWINRLEGSYVPRGLLLSKEPPVKPRPYLHGGKLSLTQYGHEWVLEGYTIREHGIVIEGPDPKRLIPPISNKELQEASLRVLNEWWTPMLSNTTHLESSEYQAYAVLTMCRMLYMFQHGTIVSKKKAADWAQNTLNKRWKILIQEALKWRENKTFNHLPATIDFIGFTIDHIDSRI